MDKVNLQQKLAVFADHWNPRIVAELNGQHVKLVKFQGPFVWHHHETEDELFLVVKGRFRMEFKDRNVDLEEGEMLVVPAAPSTGPWRMKKSTCSSSSRPRRSTPAAPRRVS